MKKIFVSICLLAYAVFATAQEKAPENWFNLDPKKDDIRGVSTERAYEELLKNKQGRTVIVAVIDSGVDIEHEDLQGKIWVNTKEIPNNAKDDDGNGFVDDVNGWNFIGGKNGKNVYQDTYEVTREFVRLSKKFKKPNPKDPEYEYFEKVKKELQEKQQEKKNQMESLKSFYESIQLVKKALGGKPLTKENILELPADQDPKLKNAKSQTMFIFLMDASPEELEEYYEKGLKNALEYGLNPKFDPRKIVGDNPRKLREKGYGNNDVKGPDAFHGTHVAGIIAANRDNAIGIKGVANNVLIMPIRAVPDGDERDKDVANAIFYAVDNGAHIINMSFGKGYSPNKKFVDEAVKYAEKKGVLLIHAAGNDAKDLEVEPNFPNRYYADGGEAKNWIEVGASSWHNNNEKFVADFSNYGKTKVDVFAPGVDIYSTVPDKNAYKKASGTSMAAPTTAGVAALLMSYYPELTAVQVKEILLKSAIRYEQEINKPGEKSAKVKLSDLCITGGIINAYEAIRLAEEMTKK